MMSFICMVILSFTLVISGPAAATSFTDNDNGTITHNDTGLVWQKEDDGTTRSWENALTYCEGLTLASATDWRLPNIKELESIADDTEYDPAIDTTYFPNTKSSYYWSSTFHSLNSFDAWTVTFANNGTISNYLKTLSYYVRCVRGGQ